ncbi:hypothetical protein [Streptomyces sp. NPDC046759]|uniref:phosphotriesterase family protein n=1 Tax=Streptomyces sp. NPDC046759 TaxID=3155019 RepID=UPI00340A719B
MAHTAYHIGREALRLLLVRRGITFLRTKTRKGSPDPERDAPAGIGRDPLGLKSVSSATDVNIVMGCDYYAERFHPGGLAELGEERMAALILADIVDGVASTGVRAGVIGEIGLGWPPSHSEVMALRAAVRTQLASGLALVIHPGRDPKAPFECVDIVTRAGGDVSR